MSPASTSPSSYHLNQKWSPAETFPSFSWADLLTYTLVHFYHHFFLPPAALWLCIILDSILKQTGDPTAHHCPPLRKPVACLCRRHSFLTGPRWNQLLSLPCLKSSPWWILLRISVKYFLTSLERFAQTPTFEGNLPKPLTRLKAASPSPPTSPLRLPAPVAGDHLYFTYFALSLSLGQEPTHLPCKGSDRKYFSLCRPYGPVSTTKSPRAIRKEMSMAINKSLFKKIKEAAAQNWPRAPLCPHPPLREQDAPWERKLREGMNTFPLWSYC